MAKRKLNLASLVESLQIEEYASSPPGPTVGFVKIDMRTRTEKTTGHTDFPSDYSVTLYFKLKRQDAGAYRDAEDLLEDLASYLRGKTPKSSGTITRRGTLSYVVGNNIWIRQSKGREFEARSDYIGAVDIFLDYAIEVLGKKRITVIQKIGDKCISRSYRYAHRK